MSSTLQLAGSKHFDVRMLPDRGVASSSRGDRQVEREAPQPALQGGSTMASLGSGLSGGPSAPAPAPATSFDGLHFTESCTGGQCGDGHPPDPNGDVGPTYYIEAINVAIGIYDKSNGSRVAAFTFNDFMSQGSFGNLCDTDNFGDPVVVYDTFHDRWIITDFAFQLDGSGNVLNPPGAYQCFAVSQSADPVLGGWNFYSLHLTDGLQDYPKFGVWPDGLYMSANMFDFSAGGSFQDTRVWALNLAQMEAGQAAQVVAFDVAKVQGQYPFGLLPANARLQLGSPPSGSPNYITAIHLFTDRVRVWKFHVDWANTSASTFTGPTDSMTGSTWGVAPSTVPSKSGNDLDTLTYRLLAQNQYANIAGVESLWDSHTVAGSSSSQAAVRWYQIPVTGGTIGGALQAATWNPDSANRFMPSIAVDRVGNAAVGYSVSSSTLYPSIRYAGRLAGDPAGTFSQTEQSLIEGTGSQSGNCGGSACQRWGDYTAMTVDPEDGCTFWYVNQYYATTGLDHHTRIGSFSFPSCASSPTPTPTPTPAPTPTADTTPPSGTITIAAGATYTNTSVVGLQTPSADGDVSQMRISNSPTMSGGLLSFGLTMAYSPSVASWDLTDATYGGTSTDGTKTVYVQWSDASGNWSVPTSDSIILDRTAPTVTKPTEAIPFNYQLGTTIVPVRSTWTPSDNLSGIAAIQFQESINGGAYQAVYNSAPLTSAIRWYEPGSTVQFRVRAEDGAGNWGAWTVGPLFSVAAIQENGTAIVESGTWSTGTSTTAYGGGFSYSTQPGAWVQYSFSGRDIAWIAYRASSRGEADVYIDGVFATRVNLYSATFESRRVVFTRSLTVNGPHTIRIVVVGTSGHPRVDLDAFVRFS